MTSSVPRSYSHLAYCSSFKCHICPPTEKLAQPGVLVGLWAGFWEGCLSSCEFGGLGALLSLAITLMHPALCAARWAIGRDSARRAGPCASSETRFVCRSTGLPVFSSSLYLTRLTRHQSSLAVDPLRLPSAPSTTATDGSRRW